MFGVLYTLSKERLTEGWRFVVSAMILDYLQVGVSLLCLRSTWRRVHSCQLCWQTGLGQATHTFGYSRMAGVELRLLG